MNTEISTGYICKKCGTPSPIGVGYATSAPANTDLSRCECGYSVAPIVVGSAVLKSGYPGTVTLIHTGELEGMADVRLSSGEVTTCISELSPA
ncbi:hypothetical protein BSP239C_03165 [Brevibacterium sp. 239c]|uniref:hypothetical protein n=1 Tax=Brevibacterium sp. 239c TaxID=1965356 RepID=UPI000C509454|nr:hypothetical protein [Brevibacterium sp. 239c]SMY00986.1 hypothetical protein BSP239C_03165 [Brevibacterium sp. 239c]